MTIRRTLVFVFLKPTAVLGCVLEYAGLGN